MDLGIVVSCVLVGPNGKAIALLWLMFLIVVSI